MPQWPQRGSRKTRLGVVVAVCEEKAFDTGIPPGTSSDVILCSINNQPKYTPLLKFRALSLSSSVFYELTAQPCNMFLTCLRLKSTARCQRFSASHFYQKRSCEPLRTDSALNLYQYLGMRKKRENLKDTARTTIASVKREMQKPRLTESVRNDGERASRACRRRTSSWFRESVKSDFESRTQVRSDGISSVGALVDVVFCDRSAGSG